MGYSTSKLTLIAQLNTGNLDNLIKGQGCRWLVQAGEASKFAYKIREALYIARLYPDDFKQLAKAAEAFTVEVVDATTVQARPTKQATEAVVLTAAPTSEASNLPQAVSHGTEIARRPISAQGQQSEFTIIDAWQKAQPSNDPIHFPEAQLSDDQLTRLYKWACGRTPPLMLMVSGSGLTVSPVDPEVEEYSWKPIEERINASN